MGKNSGVQLQLFLSNKFLPTVVAFLLCDRGVRGLRFDSRNVACGGGSPKSPGGHARHRVRPLIAPWNRALAYAG
jgi:hypothetical protein